MFGSVAQSVEQGTENPCVGGSIPLGATIYNLINILDYIAINDIKVFNINTFLYWYIACARSSAG